MRRFSFLAMTDEFTVDFLTGRQEIHPSVSRSFSQSLAMNQAFGIFLICARAHEQIHDRFLIEEI